MENTGWDQGWALGARLAEQRQQNKQWMTENEIATKASDLNTRIAGVQAEMSKDPQNPELQGQMKQLLADRTSLYHPDNGPHAMAALGKLVHQHFHGQQPQTPPTTQSAAPAVSLPQQGGAINAPAVAGTPETSSVPGTPGVHAEPGVAAVSMPGMAGAPLAMPAQAGPVVHRAQTAGDLRQLASQRFAQDMSFGLPDVQKDAARAQTAEAQAAQFKRDQTGLDRDWNLQWMQRHNVSQEAQQEWMEHVGGVPYHATREKWTRVDGTSASGEPLSYWHNELDNSNTALDGSPLAEGALQGFKPTPKSAGSQPKVGSLGEFLTAAYGPNPTPQQQVQGRALWMQAGASTTTGTHMIMVPQPDGSIKAYKVETSSSKSFPGAAGGVPPPPGTSTPSPAAPKPTASTTPTPAALRKKAKSIVAPAGGQSHAGVVQSGDVVGGRTTPEQTKMNEDVDAAVKLDSLANQAASTTEPGQQRQLALGLIKGMAGRVNMQEYAIYTRGYGVANTVEALIGAMTTGELPPGIVAQLVNDAHANLTAARAAQAEAYKPHGASAPSGGATPPPAPPPATFDWNSAPKVN